MMPGDLSDAESLDLTICICAYNAVKRLPPTLNALAAMVVPAGVGLEILFVDNASTDGTFQFVEETARALALPVRVLPEPKKGRINAVRTGAAAARGRLICFLDDDNVVDPDWIAQVMAFAASHPRAGIFGPLIYPIFEDPASRPANFDEQYAIALAVRDLGPEARQQVPPSEDGPPGAGMTGRTSVLRTVLLDIDCRLTGRKGNVLACGEDSEICLIAHRLGWELWYVPQMRLGHILPATRLNEAYINRLISEGASCTAWLEYLRGREPRRTRLYYLRRWAAFSAEAAKMKIVGKLKGARHPLADKFHFWTKLARHRGAGYLSLALDYPFAAFEQSLQRAGVEHQSKF